MPGQDVYYGYPRKGHSHSHITTEEAAGIGILTVVLGILLLIGCWYCRRRSGYRILTNKSPHAATQSTSREKYLHEVLGYENSCPSQEKTCDPLVPNAPPAYEKLSAEQSPPPYSP
ncbi:melanoma antigen recognized by T-cells 1 [Dipodomys merriami]|uniref:melanoma antigen recognized by T-cells 1 n=1 Tax=Dipodomys merriami TaxID=94247 RepID=UPI0038557CD1